MGHGEVNSEKIIKYDHDQVWQSVDQRHMLITIIAQWRICQMRWTLNYLFIVIKRLIK